MLEKNDCETIFKSSDASNIQPTDYMPHTKPKCIYNSSDRIFAIAALALGFLFIKTAFQYGLLMSLVLAGITVFNFVYSVKSGLKITFSSAIIFACMVLLSISFAISDNNTVKFVNLAVIIVSNLYLVYTSYKSKYDTVIIDTFKAVCISPFYEYSSVFGAVFYKEENSGKSEKKEKSNIFPIIIGLILSIPATILAASLLASSDSNFANIMAWIVNFDFECIFYNILIFLLSLPCGMYIFGAVYSRAYKMRNENVLPKGEPVKFGILPTSMCNAFLTPLCVIYTVYIMSQMSQLFSNLSGSINRDFDYCSYAREGFFQLCFVVILNLGIISLVVFFVKYKDGGLPRLSKIYICVFSVLTVLLIAAALTKMLMYINFYGLTPLRVYTSIFMIWLFILFVMLMIKQLKPKISITKIAYCFAVCIMLVISFAPLDGLIAKYNMKWYQDGKIDWMGYAAVYDLDASSVFYLNGEHEREILKKKYSDGQMNIYNFNFTRYFAYRSLTEK